ncbi:MAG: hypothetical protein K0S38_618 [Candidatus Paceibacter sp.]|jgi:hypothetical protein|nr:hypothetical protein [Candidatus Paceibacter sp.]
MSYRFRLAGIAEDNALRAVLRQAFMPGNISLSFCREPSFFTAEQAGSLRYQTLICEDQDSGKITGIGGRSIRAMYVDGTQRTIGYLSSLRLLPEMRSGMTLARGYKYLHSLHGDGAVPYYVTTILDENKYALHILESRRAGMPTYHPLGTFVTYLIPIQKKVFYASQPEVQRCTEDKLPSACTCLRAWNSRYQFAPAYGLDDLSGSTGVLPYFSSKNLYIYKEGNEVVGTLGVWDQQSFKQTVVTEYSAWMKAILPFYNNLARIRGLPTLPKVGHCIRTVHTACLSARDDNLEIFRSLLHKACADWSGCDHDYLLVGLAEGHKFESVVRPIASRILKSRMYLVYWPGDNVVLPKNDRIPHLEVATL